jgi:hypothetical protein
MTERERGALAFPGIVFGDRLGFVLHRRVAPIAERRLAGEGCDARVIAITT